MSSIIDKLKLAVHRAGTVLGLRIRSDHREVSPLASPDPPSWTDRDGIADLVMRSSRLDRRRFLIASTLVVLASAQYRRLAASGDGIHQNRRRAAPTLKVPAKAGVVDVTQAPYRADKSGRQDSTAAIQRAISDHVGRYAVLFFPAGTYLVSRRLAWVHDDGVTWDAKLTLWGEGRDTTTIRLRDDAEGYGEVDNPQAVIWTASVLAASGATAGGKDWTNLGEGNEGFRNSIHHLTIDCGDNPGAVAIDWMGHNNASIEWVRIIGRSFYCGISMERRWPGPCMASHVIIEGGRYGVRYRHPESNAVLDHVTLIGQRVRGIHVERSGLLSIGSLLSVNAVPAIETRTQGSQVAITNSQLTGGDPSQPAIVGDGGITADRVFWDGYAHFTPDRRSSPVTTYSRPAAVRDTGVIDISRIAGPPPTVDITDTDAWAYVTDFGADPTTRQSDDDAVQAALYSGARVVVFPSRVDDPSLNQYFLRRGNLRVPSTVEAIIGWHATISTARGGSFDDPSRLTPVFVVSEDSARPLLFKGLRAGTYQGGDGVAAYVEHSSTRDVVIEQMTLSSPYYGYRGRDGAGDVHITEYCCGRVLLGRGQRLWARQLDIENDVPPHLDVPEGAEAWVLGMKTERPGPVVRCSGLAVIVGGFHSPIVDPQSDDAPCFEIEASGHAWLAGGTSGYNDGAVFDPAVRDADRTVRPTELLNRGGQGFLLPLYKRGSE